MPVKFRGTSEYSSTYKWQPSFRSAQFQPSPQQLNPEAGLRSDQFNLLIEPSFAHKKRVPHRRAEAGSCLMWFQDDDYAEQSDDQSAELSSKTFVKERKSDGKKGTKSIGKENVKSSTKVVKKQEKATVEENKCTWEKDKQSEYIQKIREKLEAEDRSLAAKKKPSPTKKQHLSSQKKRTSPVKKTPVSTPTKSKQKNAGSEIKQKSPAKDATRSAPLRYRPLHHKMLSKHQSEYQHMYKKHSQFTPSSPLISALDVVYSHSPAIPPHKSPKMLTKSEYAAKFKPQSALSKSVPNFSSPPSPSMKMKVRDLTASPRGHKRSPKKLESEYADKYPAREFPTDVSMRIQDEAIHNKLNREGCAFDKQHTNQIYSPENKRWEISSVSASSEATVRTSEVSGPHVEKEVSKRDSIVPEEDEAEKEVVVDDDVESVVERDSLDVRSVESNSALNQPMPVARKLAWEEEDGNSTVVGSTVDARSDSSNAIEGRLPTPQLNEIGGAQRTHLDLTTPSRGGALLTSPSHSNQTKRFSQSQTVKQLLDQDLDEKPVKLSKTLPSHSNQHHKHVADVIQKAVRGTQTLVTPIQDGANCRSPEAKSSNSKPFKLSKSPKPDVPRFLHPNTRVPIQGALRSQEFQHCGRNTRPSIDFDRISVASAASIASADDLLQRSLQRRDFWKTK